MNKIVDSFFPKNNEYLFEYYTLKYHILSQDFILIHNIKLTVSIIPIFIYTFVKYNK